MNFSALFRHKNPITTDIHSHLLPGIDDGVKTIKDAIDIIKKFKLLGYSKLITTPHIMSDAYPNNSEIIQEKLHLVKEANKEENIDITLEAAAEYYVDMPFLELIEEEELITFKGNYVLFETAYNSKPLILEQAIYEMIDKGYIPVLAHPERYLYLHNHIEYYQHLKVLGVLFQVNIRSLEKKSNSINKTAQKLVQLGLVDFLGSDVHRMRDIDKIQKFFKNVTTQKPLKTILF
jgi:tyrosine-protein phosphatase YwqE